MTPSGRTRPRVRIGFRTSPQNVDWPTLEAVWAEAGGIDVFDSGWINDHLTDPGRERGGAAYEALTTLAALAHHVPGKRVGVTVLSNTFRHPSLLAKAALTLDHVTGGRYVLGLGAGWHVGEHDAFGLELPPIRERIDRFESTVRVLRALFSEAAAKEPGVTLDAPPYRLAGAIMEPAPLRAGGPELWLGGQKRRGLGIAARYADGWNYPANEDGTLQAFVERRDTLWRACEDAGRNPAELTVSVQMTAGTERHSRARALDAARAYAGAGAHELILSIPARAGVDALRGLARDVAEPLRDALG